MRDEAVAASAVIEDLAEAIYRQQITVTFDMPVCFTEHLFDVRNPILVDTIARLEPERRHRCLVFVDDGLLAARPTLAHEISDYAIAHAGQIELVDDPVPVPGGERIKNELYFVEEMQGRIARHRIDRHSYVIAVGGGAVLDAVGLVSATAHRGVRHIRVPTTVLAQADSGVGVKNGVNHYGAKNFVGAFAPPFAVLNDLDFIDGLPARDKIAGMAEAVKVALIRDGDFFTWLERHADDLITFARPAMARPLDFGHWSAHKLETLTHHHLRHGEAVAIGVALDSRYSVLAGMLEAGAEERILTLLEHLGFRLWHPALEAKGEGGDLQVMDGLREFREHLGGELTVTLLAGLGRGVEVHVIDDALMRDAIAWLKERDRAR
jgi:3-dehydroquinate synthase